MHRYYVATPEAAQRAVAVIQGLFSRPDTPRCLYIDTETAPIPGLEGYPGARRETVELEDGSTEIRFVKASKGEYLLFAQRVWRAAFDPSSLQELDLYLPQKTTSGREGDLDAKEAWRLFLNRALELYGTVEGRARLEAARWTESALRYAESDLCAALDGLSHELGVAARELDAKRASQAEYELLSAQGQKTKKVTGIKTLETTIKRLTTRCEELVAERDFLVEVACPRLETPLALELLIHILLVGAEGRVYLTTGGRNRLDPVQPGLDPYTSTIFLVQFTVATDDNTLYSWVINTHQLDLQILRPLFELQRVVYVGANIKFDLKMLMHHLGFAPKDVACVAVNSRMLNLGLKGVRHSLKELASTYLGLDLSKEIRDDFIGRRLLEPSPEMLEYSYTDTEVLPGILQAEQKVAAQLGQEQLIDTFSRLSWITALWEYRGYRLDERKWLSIAAEAAALRDELAGELEAMLLPEDYVAATSTPEEEGEEFIDESDDDDSAAVDPRSHAVIRISQGRLVLERLERLLGFDLASVCPRGKASLSKDGRNAIEREYRLRNKGETHPFFLKYSQWSKAAKQASTYGKRFLWYVHPISGRVHPTFHISGTDTGRYSSTAPNFLNLPAAKEPGDPDFRGAFVADEGHYLLGGDLEAMELRIAGDVTEDPMIQKMVLAGSDAHTFSAANMFHIRKAKVPEVQKTTDRFRYGTSEFDIGLWLVPESWSVDQIAELALSPEVAEAVKAVPQKATRTVAKMVGFLWLFRGTPYTLAQRTGLPDEACQDFFARFEQVYSKMSDGMNEASNRVYTHTITAEDGTLLSWIEGYGGIRRWTELPHNPELRDYRSFQQYQLAAKLYRREMGRCSRQLANLRCQGGNAVVTAEALLEVVRQGARFGITPWLAVYDEIIAMAPDTTKPERVKGVLESVVLDVCDQYMKFVPAGFEADVKKAGKFWVKS